LAALVHLSTSGATGAEAARVPLHCRGSGLSPSAADVATVERATVCLINIRRWHHRLPPLRESSALTSIATGQAADMVRGNYFADHSLAGRTPYQRIAPALGPAHVATTGQNIGWGIGWNATPAGIVQAWMESAPHRRIMLTRAYTQAGVGVTPSLPAVLELGAAGATYTLDVSAPG
jgi:uncharacterized protein YkwD